MRKSLMIFVGVMLLVLLVAGWVKVRIEAHELQEYVDVVERAADGMEREVRTVLNTLAAYRYSAGAASIASVEALARALLRHNDHLLSIGYFAWRPALPGPRRLQKTLRGTVASTDGQADRKGPYGSDQGRWVLAFYHSARRGSISGHRVELSALLPAAELKRVVGKGSPVRVEPNAQPDLPGHPLVLAQAAYSGETIPWKHAERLGRLRGLFLAVADLQRLVEELSKRQSDYRLQFHQPAALAEEASVSSGNTWSFPVRLIQHAVLPTGERLRVERVLAMGELWPMEVIFFAVLIAGLVLLMRWLWWSRQRQQRLAQTAQRALDRERERAYKTLYAIDDAVLVVDADWYIRYANPGAERLLSCTGEHLLGKRLEKVILLRHAREEGLVEDVNSYFLRLAVEGGHEPVRLLDRQQCEIAIDSRVSPLTFPDGNDGMVIVMRDVTVEHDLMEKLAFQASHDALTGLYNRAAFESWIREALEAEKEADGKSHAVIYIDVDRFKLVNDTCGHAAGDELLKRVSRQISKVLRSGDLMARVGGDEFGILLQECDLVVAENVARRIMDAMENFRFQWDDKLFQVHLSIGVVMVDRDADSLKEVLMTADLACHVAKEGGRNRIHVHALEDVSILRHRQQMQWLPRLHEALDNDRFELFLQPIWPLREEAGLPVMNEFLIRLWDTDGKLLPPGQFIPAAERYDLMWQIDRWMVENAFGLLSELEDDGMLYTINLSAQTFCDHSFAEFVEMTLESYGVDAKRICFELTETAAVANISVAGELMQALKELGCRILLDDFGSGLSSFGYLKNLPIDYLKIDGQFVRDILTDPLDEVMVRMCFELAQVLKVKTIAEFIEDQAVLEAVKAIGIDYGQGYHLGRPGPARAAPDTDRAAG